MEHLLLLLLPLPLLSQDAQPAPQPQGVRMVHAVFRHGDRTPIDPFPTDPYRDAALWPVGFGQLTSLGKRQQLEAGRWLRERYAGFLGPQYTEEQIYIRSTDVDRTLMSAQALLAGLFPPEGYQRFSPDLPWQPVPVHTLPQAEDYLLSSHANCPRFDELQEEVRRGEEMGRLYEENKELFQYISKHTNLSITDIVHLDYVYDTLLCETIHNFTLPQWTSTVFPASPSLPLSTSFKHLRDLSFTVDSFTPELKRLKGGPFIQLLVDHFEAFSRGEEGLKKVYLYSGHDTTVAPILDSLGVFDILAPPYCSMVLVELVEEEGLHVRVSYKNSSTTALPLTLPGCQELCPLHSFKALTAGVRVSDIRGECGLPAGGDAAVQTVTLLAAVASTLMAAAVLLAVMVLLCRGRRAGEGGTRYQPVGQSEDF